VNGKLQMMGMEGGWTFPVEIDKKEADMGG